jgi:hypothetical protein
MKLHRLPLYAAAASLAFAPAHLHAQTVATDPVGFVKIDVTAGQSATTPRPTYISIPLQEVDSSLPGQVSGVITAVTSNSIVNTNANWGAGALSQPAAPCLIQITSGAASGRIFLIASSAQTNGSIGGPALANTATNLFISSSDTTQITSLNTLGILPGDTYKIYACETIGSLFGVPPEPGVRVGTSITNSDNIQTVINGSTANYWFNTGVTPNRWSRQAAGNPNAANVALVPNNGLVYQRRTNSPVSITVTGQVPTISRVAMIKNSGTTLLSAYFPASTTLSNLGLQNLPIWTSSTSPTSADIVTLTANGSSANYFFNGSVWRRQAAGNPTTNPVIGIGTAVQILQRGSASGYTPLTNTLPYTLN